MDGRGDLDDPRPMRERMLAGEPYIYDLDPSIAEGNRRATRLLETFNASSIDDLEGRRGILTELFGAFGADAQLRPPRHPPRAVRRPRGSRADPAPALLPLRHEHLDRRPDVRQPRARRARRRR